MPPRQVGRAIRSRMDYYAASADPGRAMPGGYDAAAQGVYRASRSVEEMRRRPEALRTGYGNIRPVGMAAAYMPGMGKPSIERGDFTDDGTTQEDFWNQRGTEGTPEEEGYQPAIVRKVGGLSVAGPHTAPQTINNWFSAQEVALGLGVYGPGPNPSFRDALDAARLNWRQTPEGSYPDGYLGTVGGRRQDKLASAIWRNQRPYDRGVHKDTRLDMSDYLWPEEFNLMSGIINEATTGLRYCSPAYAIEPIRLTNRGKPNTRDYNAMTGRPDTGTPVAPDPERQASMRRMLPRWS